MTPITVNKHFLSASIQSVFGAVLVLPRLPIRKMDRRRDETQEDDHLKRHHDD